MSETAKCRERLKKYIEGYGIDIGYGGDPIGGCPGKNLGLGLQLDVCFQPDDDFPLHD